jgi:hypothetical protein
MKFAFLAIALVLLPSIGSAANQAQDISTVAHAETFTLGLVGMPAAFSKEELAARNLLKAPPAAIRQALPGASPAGRAYLLCVLRRIDPAGFKRSADELIKQGPQATVSTLFGDVMTRELLPSIVGRIDRDGCQALR